MPSLKTDKFKDKTNDEHNWLSHINKRKYVVYFFLNSQNCFVFDKVD